MLSYYFMLKIIWVQLSCLCHKSASFRSLSAVQGQVGDWSISSYPRPASINLACVGSSVSSHYCPNLVNNFMSTQTEQMKQIHDISNSQKYLFSSTLELALAFAHTATQDWIFLSLLHNDLVSSRASWVIKLYKTAQSSHWRCIWKLICWFKCINQN